MYKISVFISADNTLIYKPGVATTGGERMFEGLTKYIPDLEEKKDAHRIISKIEDAVYSFVHNNPKCGLKYYRDILKSRGVDIEKTPLSEVDAASLGWLGVMALLAAAVHGERHNCGTLSAIYEDGSLLKWLLLLKKFDEQM